jgi:hypothetical protein
MKAEKRNEMGNGRVEGGKGMERREKRDERNGRLKGRKKERREGMEGRKDGRNGSQSCSKRNITVKCCMCVWEGGGGGTQNIRSGVVNVPPTRGPFWMCG